jgi:hypothetical protein
MTYTILDGGTLHGSARGPYGLVSAWIRNNGCYSVTHYAADDAPECVDAVTARGGVGGREDAERAAAELLEEIARAVEAPVECCAY